MTLPVDPAGSHDPGGPVIRPPPPPPGKPFGGGADRRLRPIPRSPEGLRGRSSTACDPTTTRGFGHRISTKTDFLRPVHSPRPVVHKELRLVHSFAPVLLTSGLDQSDHEPERK